MTAKTLSTGVNTPSATVDLSENLQEAYQELRRVAAHLFRQERPGHTLQPTALVHEAFIRLVEHGPKRYSSQAHFFGVVIRAMRQILVEHARRHRAKKRGGDLRQVSFEEADLAFTEWPGVLALDAALIRLNRFDSGLCRIAELKVFGALSACEIATVLKRGESTIRRDWTLAKAWLQRDIHRNDA